MNPHLRVRSADEDLAVASAARRLIAASKSRTPCRPVRDLIGSDDVSAAYRVQQTLNAARLAAGAEVVGRKIGATSEAVQVQLGVDQPDFGVLFSDMQFTNGDELPDRCLIQPQAEAEVAFVLREDLAVGALDPGQCRTAVAHAMAALEIVDSRIIDWDVSFADTVADNASSGLFVLGSIQLDLTAFEPKEVPMQMWIDDDLVSIGDGAACLGDPLVALSWLARRARDFGEPLRAGQIVLSGALGPMRPVSPGSHVKASIGPLGTVEATFSNQPDPTGGNT